MGQTSYPEYRPAAVLFILKGWKSLSPGLRRSAVLRRYPGLCVR